MKTIKDLYYSDTAIKKGINNTIPDELLDNANYTLENINKLYKYGNFKINSGYRCQELNKLVGGVSNSQHTKAQAVDITFGNLAINKSIAEKISKDLIYDQLIVEQGGLWLHISYSKNRNRNQFIYG